MDNMDQYGYELRQQTDKGVLRGQWYVTRYGSRVSVCFHTVEEATRCRDFMLEDDRKRGILGKQFYAIRA